MEIKHEDAGYSIKNVDVNLLSWLGLINGIITKVT